MTLMDRFVRVGMPVQLVAGGSYRQAGGTSQSFDLNRGARMTVTNMYADNTLMVRTDASLYNGYTGRHGQVSFRLHRDALDEFDPNGPPPRKLGQKPEDTADMTYIGVDHPGIQWLWDDLARYAEGQSWCRTYEDLAAEDGLPARPAQFEIELSIPGGGTFVMDVTARSEEEATELARESLLRGVQEL